MYRLVPFSQIKENSRILIPEIAEDNIGLECLLMYCVENDIETYSSCGDVRPYIDFIINDNTKNILYTLSSLLINSQDVREYISVKLGSIDGNNICRISYYDNDKFNIYEFFDIINNSLKKAITKDNCNIELWDSINNVVKDISKYEFDNYLEVFNSPDIDNMEDNYTYSLTIHSTNYRKIHDFQTKHFPYLRQEYKNQCYNNYTIGYYTDEVDTLLTRKKLVRKK